jgi:hypothetical protein
MLALHARGLDLCGTFDQEATRNALADLIMSFASED